MSKKGLSSTMIPRVFLIPACHAWLPRSDQSWCVRSFVCACACVRAFARALVPARTNAGTNEQTQAHSTARPAARPPAHPPTRPAVCSTLFPRKSLGALLRAYLHKAADMVHRSGRAGRCGRILSHLQRAFSSQGPVMFACHHYILASTPQQPALAQGRMP